MPSLLDTRRSGFGCLLTSFFCLVSRGLCFVPLYVDHSLISFSTVGKMSGQSNHQNTNGSDTRDIALSGEPTVAMQPLGKRVASFPFQRRLDFRVGKEGKPLLKDLREGSRNTAAWVQTRGIQVPQPCASCASGHGPFSSCVVFRTADGHRFCEGSCANCYFGHKAVRCSFREFELLEPFYRRNINADLGVSSPDLPRASLLEQFQSARPTPEPQIQREVSRALI